MYLNGALFICSHEGYHGVNFPSYAATQELDTKIKLEKAHKQFFTRIHILSYFLYDNIPTLCDVSPLHLSRKMDTKHREVLA